MKFDLIDQSYLCQGSCSDIKSLRYLCFGYRRKKLLDQLISMPVHVFVRRCRTCCATFFRSNDCIDISTCSYHALFQDASENRTAHIASSFNHIPISLFCNSFFDSKNTREDRRRRLPTCVNTRFRLENAVSLDHPGITRRCVFYLALCKQAAEKVLKNVVSLLEIKINICTMRHSLVWIVEWFVLLWREIKVCAYI